MSSLPPSQATTAAYGCCHRLLLASTTVPARSGCVGRARRLTLALRCLPIAGHRLSSRKVACQAMTETESEGDGDKEEKEEFGDDASSPSVDSVAEANGPAESDSSIDNKDETTNAELLSSSDTVQNIDGDATSTNDIQENVEIVEVASGSPLPGMKQQLDDSVRIPKATIDILKDQVFGFDTFFVTSQEPYEGGVLFKGNLRGKPAKSYEKITNRLQAMEIIRTKEDKQLEAALCVASQIGYVIPEYIAQELDPKTDAAAAEQLVTKLVDTLKSNREPCLEYPRIRRVLVEVVISIVELCPGYIKIFREKGAKDALDIKGTPSMLEKYRVFLHGEGVVPETLTMHDLVDNAKRLIYEATPTPGCRI